MKVVLTKAQKFHDDIREKIKSLGYEMALKRKNLPTKNINVMCLWDLIPFRKAI